MQKKGKKYGKKGREKSVAGEKKKQCKPGNEKRLELGRKVLQTNLFGKNLSRKSIPNVSWQDKSSVS